MPVDNLMITSDSQQFTLQHEHLSASQTQGHCCHKNIFLVFYGCASLFVLECQQTFKCEDCLVWSKRLDFGFSCQHGVIIYPKTSALSLRGRNWKNTRHRWQHKLSQKLGEWLWPGTEAETTGTLALRSDAFPGWHGSQHYWYPPDAGWEITLRWLTSCSPAIITWGSDKSGSWIK